MSTTAARPVVMRWPAPVATGPVDADVRVPGSKSMTNRALVLSALADGDSFVHNPLRSRDTELMAAALGALGAEVHVGQREWTITGRPFAAPDEVIDVGNAGTVARFVLAIATLARGPVRLDGDAQIRSRPLGPLVTALRDLGVRVDAAATGGLPATVHGTGAVRGGAVTIDASSSSQFLSALLLAAPRYDEGLSLTHEGGPVPSGPHLDMTVAMLREAGVTVDTPSGTSWVVAPGDVRPRQWTIEPDLSSAAPFLAAAVATTGQVRLADWPATTTQPGGRLPELLRAFGASTSVEGNTLVVTGPDDIAGIDADLQDCGELTPVIAALAAFATTPSHLSGIGHLRGHETDRLAALATQLNALGSDVAETEDGLVIKPRPMHGGVFATYDDHRMAMAGAVIGLVVPGVVLDDVQTTRKTLPGFATMWADLLGAEHS